MVGVDLSLSVTGVAVIDVGGDAPVVSCDRVTCRRRGGSLGERAARIAEVVDGVRAAIPADADLVVVESPLPAVSGFHGLQLERAAAFWMVVTYLMRTVPVVEVHPRVRAKLATGSGNARKDDVLAAVRAAFPGVSVADHNVADALVLAGAGARWMGVPVVDYSAGQESAFTGVVWPGSGGSHV